MSSVRCKSINRDVLKWARETAGYKISDIETNRPFKDITLWESGEKFPTYRQLELLSKKYQRPVCFFFFSEIIKDPPIEKSFRSLSEEINNLHPKIRLLLRKAKVFQMNLQELTGGKNPFKDQFILHKFKIKKGSLNIKNIKKIAKDVRNFLGIDIGEQKKWKKEEEAFKRWREVLKEKGIFVFKEAFGKDVKEYSGFCLYDDEFPIICINNSNSSTRQIFTLFHELAHLLDKASHIELTDAETNIDDQNRNVEFLCNRFASEFLVPDEDLTKIKSRLQTSDFKKLAKELASTYCVSREVILRRFLDKRFINKDKFNGYVEGWKKESLKNFIERKKKTTGGNPTNTLLSYLGDGYLKLVFDQYHKNKISIRNVADYLDVKVSRVEKLEGEFLRRRWQHT